MPVVLRAVNGEFLEQDVLPALESETSREGILRTVADEETRTLMEQGAWEHAVHRLLFSEWEKASDGWRVAENSNGYAGDWDDTLHLALMLEKPRYPYMDPVQASEARRDFEENPPAEAGLASLVLGARSEWAYRPPGTVRTWNAQLAGKLNRLLWREGERLKPVEMPETKAVTDFWLGQQASPPVLLVAFTGLGPASEQWIRQLGGLTQEIRRAADKGLGLVCYRSPEVTASPE